MKQANQLWVQPFFIYIFLCIGLSVHAQQKITPASIKDKMQWFADAKLGIFIHAGIYSVDGIDESWSFYNKKISYDNYMKQLNGFTLKNYNPAAWAELIQEFADDELRISGFIFQ